MPLLDHLAELRARLLTSMAAIAVCGAIGWALFDPILDLLTGPFRDIPRLAAEDGIDARLVFSGIADPFTFKVRVSAYAGVVLAAPVWLYQIWAFVVPGMTGKEKRYSYLFLVTAVPLFFVGVAAAYWILPKGLRILIELTPADVSNYVQLTGYLSFVLRLLLVFGLAFELPVFLVLLNFVGILSARRLRSWTRGILVGIFVFAAMATPTGDPLTMMFLALPMVVLFAVAVGITSIRDRRRRLRSSHSDHPDYHPDYDALGDDEASRLEPVRPLESDPDGGRDPGG